MPEFLAAFDKPMTVEIVDGDVVILGPDAVAISITPEAAEESGWRLIEAARRVRGDSPEPPRDADG